ncbi:non-ribosomal peptide synthetase [Nostoc sp. CHAB 5715]|uniref:non-ribosomal peptide synthetase n=1 Tax=Nostoc sp. CHAB 5715 TaxID=2780400 RepID=UPI001E297545|nr:non-ribosomal peptide synthetase [Nostoc sp. CHAB 5715]MCC5621223.1 amino acid adenylation domain-containing protein [Nostoc sp. CHAB 5715]
MSNSSITGFELSPQQKHLWLLQQETNSFPYRSYCQVEITGNLKIENLKTALHSVIKKHKILSTIFSYLPGMNIPLQVIENDVNLLIQEHDFRSIQPEKQKNAVELLIESAKQQIFDFEKSSPLQVSLAILSASKYVLLLNLPSLYIDATSLNNLVVEISRAYTGSLPDEEPVQYIVFSDWQNELLESEEAEIGREYWRQKDIVYIFDLKLPNEKILSGKIQFEPQIFTHIIPNDLTSKITTIVEKFKTTESTLLLTCWQILLWRLTNVSNIIVGTNCDGRSEEELQEMLGLFAKYVPVNCHLKKTLKFYEVLQNITLTHNQASQMSVLLTQQHLIADLDINAIQVVCIDSDWQVINQQKTENPTITTTELNLAYVIYTSGSTGKPKGTLIPHQGLVNYLSWCTQAYAVEQGVGTLVHSPLGFDLTITSLLSPLFVGRTVELLSEEQVIENLSQALAKSSNLSLVKITPAHLELLKQQLSKEDIANKTRAFIIGGENLLAESITFWQDVTPDTILVNEYGPTETVVGCCVYQVPVGKHSSGSIPIGKPIANTQLYILDESLQPVPMGVPGELHIGGLGLARGYLNQAELTALKFIPNPFSNKKGDRLYKTGDLVRYLQSGDIEYIGRIDNQIKIRGYRIELGEIEAIISQHPVVKETVVIVSEESVNSQRIVAYIVPKKEQTLEITGLRSFLESKLPSYMVPAAFVKLEALPLTPNGKVDRKALPLPDKICPELEDNFVEPQTTVEKQLAAIWAEVLGIENIGVNDNFFRLGGDSILSLQVIFKANQVGFNLTSKQLFQHQTIAQLAAIAGTTRKIQAEQMAVTGLLELIPIQHWFFEQKQPEPHHWNQAVFLESKQKIDPVILEEVVESLQKHHDVLRLRFIQKEFSTQALIVSPDDAIPLVCFDFSALPEDKHKAAIEAVANKLQASLNLSQGPLFRVALFNLGENQAQRLLWIIHHLAVDGVSWRILIEDFKIAYQQIIQGKEIDLPLKTTSYKEWSSCLHKYAQSSALLSELDFWLTTQYQSISPIPRDFPGGNNIEETTSIVSVSLSLEETQSLLQQVPAAYRTQINDVFLTALILTFNQWTGEDSLLIDLEGHGREEIFEDVDLSRTVGWFTTIFPVHLHLKNGNDLGKALKSIKEQVRAIPNRGIGYGLLRYLSQDKKISEQSSLSNAEVAFNYLGQFDQVLPESSLFRLAQESSGSARSSQSKRTHLLEINGGIYQGNLEISWSYSNKLHRQTTIEVLAQNFVETLRSLIAHCESLDAGGFTPSDFAEFKQSQWGQADLDAIATAIGDI